MRLVILFIFLFAIHPVNANNWEERVAFLIDAYEKSSSKPKPVVYPELAERVKNIFNNIEKKRIVINVVENNKQKSKTELYYRNGELHVLQYDDGWNLITEGDFVYEWKFGEKSGIRIAKNEKDLVDYIIYLTDPALFMTGLYNKYKRYPDRFNVLAVENVTWKELVFKEPLYGFEAVFVNEDAFWFYGFRIKHPESKNVITYHFTKPTEYERLPELLFNRKNSIKFTDSDKTIRRHLDYL